MKTLTAIIESAENNYAAYIEGLDGIVATGETVTDIKESLLQAVNEYVLLCEETGCEVPLDLRGNYRIEFKMDVKSLLNLFSKVFTKSGLERLTGINQKQLWHYASGMSVPRRAQVTKIENAIHRLADELHAIRL